MKKVTKVATALLAASLSVLPLASCKSKDEHQGIVESARIRRIRRDYYKNFVARVEQYLRFVFHDAQYESIQ